MTKKSKVVEIPSHGHLMTLAHFCMKEATELSSSKSVLHSKVIKPIVRIIASNRRSFLHFSFIFFCFLFSLWKEFQACRIMTEYIRPGSSLFWRKWELKLQALKIVQM